MRSVILLLSFITMVPANAQEAPASQVAQAPAHNASECYCRAQGRLFAVGEKVCLRTAEGLRVAQCEMVINMTSWGITEIPCPET